VSKKNFKDDNPALAFISRETPDAQNAQDAQEVARVGDQTQGRKGKKLPRINMAFTQENLDYLRIISRIEGVSMTDYVNRLLEADKGNKSAVLQKAKRILRGVE